MQATEGAADVPPVRRGRRAARATWWRRIVGGWGLFAVLSGAAFALYAPALENRFLLDDRLLFEAHPDVREPAGLWRLFGHDYWHGVQRSDPGLYRPLTILSFHLNARLTGASPAGMRAVNVALLALLAWLLGAWLRAWDVPRAVAASAALLFVAHPLQAAVVDYVVGRSDLQVLVGVLGFLLCQHRAQRAGSWSLARLLGGAAFAILAFGSKESGVVLLPLACLQAWCAPTSQDPAGARRARVSQTSAWLVLVPLCGFLLARHSVVGWGHVYGPGFGEDPLGNPLIGLSAAERLPSSFWIALFYARQLVAPDPSFWHVPEQPFGWGQPGPWLGAGVVLAGLLLFFRSVLRRSPAAVALGFAGGQLLIVGQLFKPLALFAANRLAGPFLVAACALAALWLGRWSAVDARRRWIVVAAAVAASLAMTPAVRSVGESWRDGVSMVSIDRERHPDELDTLTAYASATLEAGHFAAAAAAARRAVEKRPEYAGNWFVLGTAQLARGQAQQARQAFAEVLDRTRADRAGRSYRARALINLAGLELESGNLAAGRRHLGEAEAIWPDDLRVLTNLALLAELERDRPEAIRRWRRIVERHPDQATRARQRLAELEGRR